MLRNQAQTQIASKPKSHEHSGGGQTRPRAPGAEADPQTRGTIAPSHLPGSPSGADPAGTWWVMSGRTSPGSRPFRSSSALCLSQLSSSNVFPTYGQSTEK